MRIVGKWITGLRSGIRVNRREDDEWEGVGDEWCRNFKRRKRRHGMVITKMINTFI
jgi:hypothetical protein